MHERDARLRSRYLDRVLGGSDDRALVTSSGRVIATSPRGLDAARSGSRCRRYGGEFTLPSGVPAFAEPLDRDGAFLVRRLEHAPAGQLRRRGPAAPAGRRSPARGRRRPLAAARPPAGRDPRAAVPAPRRPDHRAARHRGLRRRREQQHASAARSRGCASSSGCAIETDPYRLAGHVESDARARARAAARAARCRRRPSSTPGRCCRTPTRPASSASATRSRAGCATR